MYTLGYIAQLRPPPPSLACLEKSILNYLLHVPNNAFRAVDFLNLRALGGPQIPSAVVLCKASCARTAIRTLPFWEASLRRVRDAAEEHLPFALYLSGQLLLPFWDNEPIAITLANGHSSVPSQLHLQLATHGHKRSRLQREVALFFRSALFPPDWGSVFHKRLSKMFGNLHEVDTFLSNGVAAKWDPAFLFLAKLNSHTAMCVIKTLANAWTTTHRLNESVRMRCIFGSEDPVVTKHYIVCDALARIVAEAGLVGLSSNVLCRLCIQNPDAIHACFMFVAFDNQSQR